MILIEPWIIVIWTAGFFIILLAPFIRRIGRAFRRVPKATRRMTRKVSSRIKAVRRVKKRFAKTDPEIFQAINTSSKKNVENAFNRKDKKWIKEKDIKKKVKSKVAIEIESLLQESPMREMRPLVDKTIDATIDLAFLKEISKRGDEARIAMASPIAKLFWRLLFPLATVGVLGGLTYIYPDIIPPGSLIIPERIRPPTGGPLLPVDPLDIVVSTAINAAVFGIGALALVGLIILIRRR